MARRSSNSSRSRSGSQSSFSARSQRTAPVPRPAAEPVVARPSTGGGMLSNMAGAVTSGLSHGIGFGVAQRVVDGFLGPRQMEVSHTNEAPPMPQASQSLAPIPAARSNCQSFLDDFNQCVGQHSDISLCQPHLDALKSCQARSV